MLLAEVMDKMPELSGIWSTAWMWAAACLILAALHPGMILSGIVVSGFLWMTSIDPDLWQFVVKEDPAYATSVSTAIFAPFVASLVGAAIGIAWRRLRRSKASN
jgi:ABC-type Fe3+ transport system permease subunit